MKNRLELIYRKLFSCFGPQYWWPAETPFEVIIGAILTQNTNWLNVEKAIGNLRQHKLLTPERLYRLKDKELALKIRSAGYYNIKAKRMKEFLNFFLEEYSWNLKKMAAQSTLRLRRQLLEVKGIGPETADSILLYALNKPVFVVDAYTKRILLRHALIADGANYSAVQNLFMQNLRKSVKSFNEYHALLVKLGKDYCHKSQPKCGLCPLGDAKRRRDA